MREARLLINREALRHNLRAVRAAAPEARILAMVKADAYGHGAQLAAETLTDADGFGVAYLEEALALRKAGIRQPIVMLEGAFSEAEMAEVVRQRLSIVVHQEEQIRLLESCPLSGVATGAVDVWLKIDTGMHRLGFAPEAALAAFQRLRAAPVTGQIGLLTHFAAADDPTSAQTERQIDRFRAVQRTLTAVNGQPLPESLANSAAILDWPAAHGDWVRPGLMLYGASPFADRPAATLGLRPAMTLMSRLIAIRSLKKGESVGYGATWTAREDTRIGVIAIGYGDGYPRHACNGTPVLAGGFRVPLAGRVSMDMITVDLGDLPLKRGAPCILWGENPQGGESLPADEVAAHADTLSYELFCKVTARVRREVW